MKSGKYLQILSLPFVIYIELVSHAKLGQGLADMIFAAIE